MAITDAMTARALLALDASRLVCQGSTRIITLTDEGRDAYA
ncbi:hypothetical protein [Streptomyces sp. ISL-96]|nr:hypothetical protein [Streptomyces sp. ISL-96]